MDESTYLEATGKLYPPGVTGPLYPCCPHCADDQPHIEKDTHELPCDVCVREALGRPATYRPVKCVACGITWPSHHDFLNHLTAVDRHLDKVRQQALIEAASAILLEDHGDDSNLDTAALVEIHDWLLARVTS
jgi:hypothetical protein